MKCLIVDDDEMSRKFLENLCAQIQQLELLKSCTSALEAISCIAENKVDVMLLDIQMPHMSGLDLVKSVPNLPQVIFTTSCTEYALEAFEHKVTDYIQKPVTLPRLVKAIARVQERVTVEQKLQNDDVYVKVDGRLIRIDTNDVLYVESLGDYVVIHTEKKEKFIVHSTLKNIDDKITNPRFLKVHRSFIINMTKIIDIQESNLLIKDRVIPVSRAQRPALMNYIHLL